MTKQTNNLNRLVQDIFATQTDEIQCDAAAVEMVRASTQPLSAEELQTQYPRLAQHLQFCIDCAQEYELLRDVRADEAAGELTIPQTVPPVPDDMPSLWRQIQDKITAVFSGFSEAAPLALSRGSRLGIDPVDVELDDGNITVTIDVDVSEQDATLRNLFITIMPVTDMPLVGITAVLIRAANHHIIAETTLDELGDGAFLEIPPGQYELLWQTAAHTYVIEDLVLP